MKLLKPGDPCSCCGQPLPEGRWEHSLRYEVFDNPEVVAFIASIIIRGAMAP